MSTKKTVEKAEAKTGVEATPGKPTAKPAAAKKAEKPAEPKVEKVEKVEKVAEPKAEKVEKPVAEAPVAKKAPAKKAPVAAKKEKAQALTDVDKKDVIAKFGKNPQDTGSAAVQIALLTKRINELTNHLKEHKQDKHSRRGLMKLVGQRRGLLNYLEKTDLELFRSLKKELEIR